MCKKLVAFAVVLALALGMTACKEKTASENVTDAVDSAERHTKEAVKDAGEAVGDAAEATGDAVEDATQ